MVRLLLLEPQDTAQAAQATTAYSGREFALAIDARLRRRPQTEGEVVTHVEQASDPLRHGPVSFRCLSGDSQDVAGAWSAKCSFATLRLLPGIGAEAIVLASFLRHPSHIQYLGGLMTGCP
jgi:hypothetical protein